ncbi:MAG: hypothetical protein IIC76_05605 [Bacteroidetes bacterium]|nr:hypothetical protein [Bacteroidota bacterium]
MNKSETNLNFDWMEIIPSHDCKIHLIVIEQTHSVNSSYNIVIGRKKKCKICDKIFEQFDPRGLDKLFK